MRAARCASYPGFVAEILYSKITTSNLPSEIQGELATLLIDEITTPTSLTVERLRRHVDGPDAGPDPHNLLGEVERFVTLVETSGDA